jgi:hypothetical protein
MARSPSGLGLETEQGRRFVPKANIDELDKFERTLQAVEQTFKPRFQKRVFFVELVRRLVFPVTFCCDVLAATLKELGWASSRGKLYRKRTRKNWQHKAGRLLCYLAATIPMFLYFHWGCNGNKAGENDVGSMILASCSVDTECLLSFVDVLFPVILVVLHATYSAVRDALLPLIVHDRPKVKPVPHTCPHCSAQFDSAGDVSKHARTHKKGLLRPRSTECSAGYSCEELRHLVEANRTLEQDLEEPQGSATTNDSTCSEHAGGGDRGADDHGPHRPESELRSEARAQLAWLRGDPIDGIVYRVQSNGGQSPTSIPKTKQAPTAPGDSAVEMSEIRTNPGAPGHGCKVCGANLDSSSLPNGLPISIVCFDATPVASASGPQNAIEEYQSGAPAGPDDTDVYGKFAYADVRTKWMWDKKDMLCTLADWKKCKVCNPDRCNKGACKPSIAGPCILSFCPPQQGCESTTNFLPAVCGCLHFLAVPTRLHKLQCTKGPVPGAVRLGAVLLIQGSDYR